MFMKVMRLRRVPHLSRSRFQVHQAGGGKTWAAEHVVGVAKGAPEDIIADLRANFRANALRLVCIWQWQEVAHREGYPEIGLYWEKAALRRS